MSPLFWFYGSVGLTYAGEALFASTVAYFGFRALNGSRSGDLSALALGSVTWAAAVAAGLWLLRSELPADLRRKKPTTFPRVAEGAAAETMSSGTEP